jgi:hypothetical protein
MSEDRFRVFFRMNRESFHALVLLLHDDLIFKNQSRNPQAPIEIQLATALYFLGSAGASVVRGAAQLGIGEGTTRLYCDRSISALVRLLPKFVTWPRPATEEFRRMRSRVEEMSGFPGCIGFLDGTDLVLRNAPSYHGETYFNRKKQYALNIQGICDSERRFTFIAGGFPASVGDASVFGSTSFFKRPNLFFSRPDEYILADKAYRVTRRCMTPYKEPLASQEIGGYKQFNLHLAEARVKIEHSFGVLKNRWGSLRSIPINIRKAEDHVRVLSWIMSCIVLHNFLCNYESDEEWLPNELLHVNLENMLEREGQGEMQEDEIIGVEAERRAGTEWRNRMLDFFFNQ